MEIALFEAVNAHRLCSLSVNHAIWRDVHAIRHDTSESNRPHNIANFASALRGRSRLEPAQPRLTLRMGDGSRSLTSLADVGR